MSSGGNTVGTPRARELGAALRQARQAKQLTLKQVAEQMNRNESHPSRWENGKLVPSAEDIGALLQILGITGEERERIIQLAREIESPDWVAPGAGKQLAALIETERVATEIISVEPMMVPGLLQTEDYAFNIMEAYGENPVQARHGALLRVGRQSVLARRNPPKYVGAVGEFALRYSPFVASVMIEQLQHLLEMGRKTNVTIVVIPHRMGYYTPALFGSFVIVESAGDRPMVQLESYGSSTTLSSLRAVGAYRTAADTILNSSLSAEKSAALIEKIMREMERKL